MGFEKAEPGDAHDEQEKFNDNNFGEASGYLNPIPFRDIEYLPVTCSHTAATVNIVQGWGGLDCTKNCAMKKAISTSIKCCSFARHGKNR